jgi:hypothetical protein
MQAMPRWHMHGRMLLIPSCCFQAPMSFNCVRMPVPRSESERIPVMNQWCLMKASEGEGKKARASWLLINS